MSTALNDRIFNNQRLSLDNPSDYTDNLIKKILKLLSIISTYIIIKGTLRHELSL